MGRVVYDTDFLGKLLMSFANSNKREAFMFYMLFGYKNSDTEALDFIMNDLK